MPHAEKVLTQAEINRNNSELDATKAALLSLLEINQNTPIANKLDELLALIPAVLGEEAISLGLTQGEDALRALLINELTNSAQIKEQDFNRKLKAWAAEYKRLDEKASKDLRERVSQQPPGIAHSLASTGGVSDTTWGNDYDIRIALKGIIKHPSQITADGAYILSPGSITVSADAVEAEKALARDFLYDSINVVLNKNHNFTGVLLVPVNRDQVHWQLVQVNVNQGSIVGATLWDEMLNPTLSTSASYKSAQAAINRLNEGVQVVATSTGTQKDGSHCADRTIQRAVIIVNEHNEANNQPPILPAVAEARADRDVRKALVVEIIKNTSREIRTSVDELRSEAEIICGDPAKPVDDFLRDLEEKLKPSRKIAEAELKKLQALQSTFDSYMAQKLQELYKANTDPKKEGVLITEAKSYAYKSFQKHFGLFSQGPSKPVGATHELNDQPKKSNNPNN